MGRLTQCFDYLTRKPEDFTWEFVRDNYTHFEITPKMKDLRKELKLYKEDPAAENNTQLFCQFE